METSGVEEAVLDGYLETLSALREGEIRVLVHARVKSAAQRAAFASASDGVSRETLILLAATSLARQKLQTPVTPSSPFPVWYRGESAT